MEEPACGPHKKDARGEELDEDTVVLTLVPVLQDSTADHPMESSISSREDAKCSGSRPEGPRESDAVHPNKQFKPPSKRRQKQPVLPLPQILPPIHMVHRNTVRDWCQQRRLSTDGTKIEVYARLQRHAYPEQNYDLPTTSMEARLRKHPLPQKHSQVTKKKQHQPRCDGRMHKESQVTKKKQHQPRCDGRMHKESRVAEVVTSPQVSTMAAWSRIAARTAEPGAVKSCSIPTSAFLQKASGVRWCVVHGRLLSANVMGWLRLQFQGGYTWVPHTHRKMIPLFLLPACVFPSQEVEDNILCPECVKSNKKIMQRLLLRRERKRRTSEGCGALS